ncbi:glycosyltransferase family 2 protein [Chryseobacterium sp. CP-77]|uniref:glycosyltransferase family 2 protein n=1 Tax=Chryseobacterium sp. CP-77 TaxID=3116594 RepID=UPI002ECFEDE6
MMNPKVSVVMITYGHEKYIEESINGVLSQAFNGEIELIISDDCSPDNTEAVVKNIINTHPNGHWIKYIKHTKNKGAIPNFVWTICESKGQYIAICEGDDYWKDPLKLQKQVDFLEENPDYSLTFHKINELTTRDEKFTYPNPDTEETYTIEDLAKENFIITVSVVFRKNMEILPDWLKYSPIGDYPMHMLNASFGLIKYFPQEMATYRVGSGMWSTQNKVDQMVNTMYCLRFLLLHFKSNKEVHENLLVQYNNFRNALIRPFDEKKALDLKLKDYRYIETITNMGSLLKIMKSKIMKKLKL